MLASAGRTSPNLEVNDQEFNGIQVSLDYHWFR
jgi:hypothetical protein